MNKLSIPLIIALIIGCVVLFMGIFGISSYNGLTTKSQAVDNAWAQVEVQYQRRYDLIPNLVESVKGAQIQEQEIFTKLAEARANYAGVRAAGTVEDKVQASAQLDSALSRLLVVTENYPQLTSNETIKSLMVELEGTENRVSVERKRYNDVVTEYNQQIAVIPGVLWAKLFGFAKRTYFEATSGSENAPSVKFTE